MKQSLFKHTFLVALFLFSLGLAASAHAQVIQTTTYDHSHSDTGQGCASQRDILVDTFQDSYDLTTGLHTGSVSYSLDFQSCGTGPFGGDCDYEVQNGQLWAYVVYDVNGAVIASDSRQASGNNFSPSWSNRPGASVGRIVVTHYIQENQYINDGTGGCYNNNQIIIGDDVCDSSCFTQVTPCPNAASSSFSASPSSINPGQNSTLSWNVPNALSVTISGLGTFPASGSVVVSPSSTTQYTLTANGAAGCPVVTLQATVSVAACQTIGSFGASASTIYGGQSTTLSYSLSGASTASITDLLTGAIVSVPVQSGSLVVTPATTRTYRLTVTGPCATLTHDLTVTVNPPVIGSFTASASPVCAGGLSNLSWSATGGTSATISATGLPGSPVSVDPNGGTLGVNPTVTTQYTLAVTNSAGTVTSQVTVVVTPAPSIGSFGASPAAVNAGQSTTLSYTSSGGTSATITDLTSGTVTSGPVPNGSLSVTPASTRTYRLTVSGACGSVTQDVTVTVTQPPSILSYSASPASVCPCGSSTLTWTSSGATAATITDTNTGSVNPVPVNGSLAVAPVSTRVYRLTVANGAGSVTQDVTVTVLPPTSIDSYGATATTIPAGQSTTLSWSSSNGTSATIQDLTAGTSTAVAVNGTMTVTPATTRTYRLTVAGPCGTVSQDLTITVTPCQTINSYTASATTINAGQSVTLTWSTTGSSAVYVYDVSTGTWTTHPGGNGSVVVTPASTRTYRLLVDGPCARLTQDITITVNPCQTINSYTASATTINAGQSVTLSWSTTGASAVYVYDVSTGTWTTHPPGNGSVVVTPATSRTYRLLVDGPCTRLTQDIAITVNQPPTILTYSASPASVCPGSSTTLSWTSSGATAATITDTNTGSVTPVAVNGSLPVSPLSTRVYRLTVANGAGNVTQDLTVTVLPLATIDGFGASPSTVNTGQSTTLSWSSSNGSSATVTDLTSGTVTNVGVNSSLVVSPPTTRTYRLTLNGTCNTATRDLTVTVNPPGQVLLGPQGQPGATGPTSTDDDYTNMTLLSGVAVPFGGVTTAGGNRVFTNTVRNPQSVQADTFTISAPSIPAGFTVEVNVGAGFVSLNGGATATITVGPSSNVDFTVRITAPSAISVLSGYSTVLRARSGLTPSATNDTIDRLWTGFVRADKAQVITNTTGVGAATDPVPGATVEYVVTYTNVTASSGTSNVNLTATNVVLTENGLLSPNNWGLTTLHVAGSASDSRGGSITGDVAGSTLLTDTIPSLAPGQSGVFRFRRVVR